MKKEVFISQLYVYNLGGFKMTKNKTAGKTAEKEFLSEWFIAGLNEVGLSEAQFLEQPMKEKNKIKQYLAALGHF